MKKLALIVLGACLFHGPIHAGWNPMEWGLPRDDTRHGSWGRIKYADMKEEADKLKWERVCQYLLKNPSVKKEPTWIDFLRKRYDEDPESCKHFIDIVYAEYFGSWRGAKTVQLYRLRKIAEAIIEGKNLRQLADLRAALPTPPSWKNKAAALASLAALGTCAYFLWQDYCCEAEAEDKA